MFIKGAVAAVSSPLSIHQGNQGVYIDALFDELASLIETVERRTRDFEEMLNSSYNLSLIIW